MGKLNSEGPLPLPYDGAISLTSSGQLHKGRTRPRRSRLVVVLEVVICICSLLLVVYTRPFVDFVLRLETPTEESLNGFVLEPSFFVNISETTSLCPGFDGKAKSYAGHIGLKGDSDETPKRSFFWYFASETDPAIAPIVVSVGGGPGTTGLANPLMGQSPCSLNENVTALVPNPYRWTEHFNLLAIDHPIGVGYSYGTFVNNSRDAAFDVYDFLQKFLHLHPHLVKNKFVLVSGSYGGVYIPNMATVIHEQNLDIASFAHGRDLSGRRHINLEALIISNPMSDPTTYFPWNLHYMCEMHRVFNSTTCAEKYSKLPDCLSRLELAYEWSNVDNRYTAMETCFALIDGDLHDVMREDIRKKCHPDPENPVSCFSTLARMEGFMNKKEIKTVLGIPARLNFTALSMDVNQAFANNGDVVARHFKLYEPLLESGIRILHYLGKYDANVAWPTTFAWLKLIHSPFHDAFLAGSDIPYPSEKNQEATVRAVGNGAGNFTMVLLENAGHFVVHDQPALAKDVIERWIFNEPWFPT